MGCSMNIICSIKNSCSLSTMGCSMNNSFNVNSSWSVCLGSYAVWLHVAQNINRQCVNNRLQHEQRLQHNIAVCQQWVAVWTTVSMWLQVGVYVKVVMQAIDANKSLQEKHIMKKGLQHEQKDAACTTDIVWLSVAEYVNREVQHEQQLQSDSRLEYVNNGCSINTNCSVTKICSVSTLGCSMNNIYSIKVQFDNNGLQ